MRSNLLHVEPLEVGNLFSGEIVIDLHHHHVSVGENVLRFLLKEIEFPTGQNYLQKIINLPVDLGPAQVVSTKGIPDSRLCYARRYGKDHHSRFVLDVSPPHLNTVVVQLRKVHSSSYECYLDEVVITKELHHDCLDPKSDVEAYRFWQNHAFVFGEVEVDLETVVTKPPYLF